MYEPIVVSNRDYLQMCACILMEYSKRFGIPLNDTIDLFDSNGVYEMIDRGRSQYITQSAGYMAYHIKSYLENKNNP